ncbi:MAG: elongation factor G [Bosea sp.]|uniref:elongation factor G n=1 Tax=unclassified Bosea (in: a-proteobacteria) TaxID=2653178 RepID=UPI000969077C|nr:MULTISPECIES: elongation factor G [unclassified Bosea (in: a-proteobacteria)]MBN9455948.1 elongation factor G [Bosea sp. (in: a-proteobacteria)]OJV05894.1 MAG: elongation factor G [Bosea sp. 67-29]
MATQNGKGDAAPGTRGAGPRCVALVGPFQSGKTTLLESILMRCGALSRTGSVKTGNTVGDASAEARAHQMSVEPNVASVDFLGDTFQFIDCPGSVEFLHEMRHVLPAVDAAVVVCEADDRKAPALELVLRELEEADIPRFLFLNKIDTAARRVRETLAILQRASRTPLLLRQIPIWKNGIAVGFIDLALERAFIYREHAPSEIVPLAVDESGREKDARFSMLEKLADYDDELMEELLGDMEPPRDRIFDDLARELQHRHVVPVLIGAAERGNGVTRLLKALRHEAPGLAETRGRIGVVEDGPPLAQVMKSWHAGQGGKLSLARVMRGRLSEGDVVTSSGGVETRIAGIVALKGSEQSRKPAAAEGEVAGFAKLDGIGTGEAFMLGKQRAAVISAVAPPEPVHTLAIAVNDRKDDVRLAAALQKIAEEDTALLVTQVPELGETRLSGQGEMHLRVTLEKLAGRYGVTVTSKPPQIGYRETIRGQAGARGRHRKQSGGHGQYGDVVIEVAGLPRGEGIRFVDKISGGVVPRQYIGSVEAGMRDYCERGPLGFPVVDVAVTLTDGSYHTVDSSDMAFRQAARLAMQEAMPQAKPVLLEPVLSVEVVIPSEAMSRASALISARRGQILGYDTRPGWRGWDQINALLPEAEMPGLIVELRSATSGVGSFSARFDHLAELAGKPADAVVSAQALAQAR